jgi:hypothetical protein
MSQPFLIWAFLLLYLSWGTKYVYIKSTTVYVPLVVIGTLPTTLSPARVPLPPEPVGGAHSPESQFGRLEKKLSTLPALCRGAIAIVPKTSGRVAV